MKNKLLTSLFQSVNVLFDFRFRLEWRRRDSNSCSWRDVSMMSIDFDDQVFSKIEFKVLIIQEAKLYGKLL